ncbi:hypothetical protein N7488_007371 [Penicillium malachiteum]|nr:hypothetical protein N7488_007371 [Penicillium malachiteum]
MDFRIERIDKEDLPFLGEFIHSAKLALSINRLIYLNWPNEELQSAQYLRAVTSGFHDTSAECFKAIDNVAGEIVGYINVKSHKAENLLDKKPDPKSPIPEGLNPPLLAEVNNAVSEIAKETEGMERFVITYMCVKPTTQRHGVGSKLVQLGIDRAKAGGVPLTVCAEAPSIPFFTSLGFVEMKHVDMDLRKYAPDNSGFGIFRLAGMIWRPE